MLWFAIPLPIFQLDLLLFLAFVYFYILPSGRNTQAAVLVPHPHRPCAGPCALGPVGRGRNLHVGVAQLCVLYGRQANVLEGKIRF